jgi:pyruvate,water dikinase
LPAALRAEIEAAYKRLGAAYVAVRSSGSAEDLEAASFAGLHDTYLDMRGPDEVLDAVRRCWASLWTGRATFYRHSKHFDHLKIEIAVVVQAMVESEVSGVMFTGNPMNCANHEAIINASYGLGEAVVQGITTPDQFVINTVKARMIEKTLGAKQVRIVRNPRGPGTVTEDVPADKREAFALSDQQALDLAALGRSVCAHYEEFPQDIEWALANGTFYLLQSRPITNVEFSWDSDINESIPGEADEFQLWSRAYADEGWAGAVTPLMFSWRGLTMNFGHAHCYRNGGFNHLDYATSQTWHFWKGKAYYNVDIDRRVIEDTAPPSFRQIMINRLPKAWREEVMNAPFKLADYVQMHLRFLTQIPKESFGWTAALKEFQADPKNVQEALGLAREALKRLPDADVKAYIQRMFDMELEYGNWVWAPLVIMLRDATAMLNWMITSWYKGDNQFIYTDLVTGSPERSYTSVENTELWELSQRIRKSSTLRRLFDAAETAPAFFGRLDESEDGREFAAAYDGFIERHGHRGHSDRDMSFLRRAENPSVDFLPLKALVNAASGNTDPNAAEEKLAHVRAVAAAEVIDNLVSQPFGFFKAELFKLVHNYVLQCNIWRDNERYHLDRYTFSIKKGFLEISRRLMEKGLLETDRDFNFLTWKELYDLLDGTANLRLTQAKIVARKRDFDRYHNKEVPAYLYIRRDEPVEIDQPERLGDGEFKGIATSRGAITARARVVRTLDEIPLVQDGEIIIVNATDPGWTPVFMIIKGIVLETGGMLAHGSLLAREYGLPAVQLEGAMQLIPSGALITVDGNHGTVKIMAEPPELPQAAE